MTHATCSGVRRGSNKITYFVSRAEPRSGQALDKWAMWRLPSQRYHLLGQMERKPRDPGLAGSARPCPQEPLRNGSAQWELFGMALSLPNKKTIILYKNNERFSVHQVLQPCCQDTGNCLYDFAVLTLHPTNTWEENKLEGSEIPGPRSKKKLRQRRVEKRSHAKAHF